MQMSMRCGGDFITNASVVDQISKRQDICQDSSKNPTTPLAFVLQKLLRDDVLLFINCFRLLQQKLLPKAKGVSPVQIGKSTLQRASLRC